MKEMHYCQDLITIFNRCFFKTYNTKLVKGTDEPIYIPANDKNRYHQVVFAHGFYASAFHEISHWCIAGSNRRQLEDYGYWYCPDGRDAQTQSEFEKLEIRPQALDWFFCVASGYRFNVSCDNLEGDFEPDRLKFHQAVYNEVINILDKNSMPLRAKIFLEGLQEFYNKPSVTKDDFIYPKTLWDL